MLAGTIVNLKTFFETQCLAIAGVSKFIYGDAQKLIAYSKSNPKFAYPLVHLNKPILMPANNGMGNNQVMFYLEVTALAKLDKSGLAADFDAKELTAENLTLNTLLELERQLRIAHRAGTIDFESEAQIEPVMSNWIDSTVGYKMSFSIALGANSSLCN